MKLYQIVMTEDGFQKENFHKEASSAREVLDYIRAFQWDAEEFRIMLNDEIEISGTI